MNSAKVMGGIYSKACLLFILYMFLLNAMLSKLGMVNVNLQSTHTEWLSVKPGMTGYLQYLG